MRFYNCRNNNNSLEKITLPITAYAKESDKAYCFKVDDISFWIPKSQIVDFATGSDSVSFYLPSWLVKEKELETYIDTSDTPSLFD